MTFLIFRTTHTPSAWSIDFEDGDVNWPIGAPIEGAFRQPYFHTAEDTNVVMGTVDGWAVELADWDALTALCEKAKHNLVLCRFAGHWALEIYDSYRE